MLSEAFRKKRNHVTQLIEDAKDLEMWNSFKNVIDNPKQMWKKVNTYILNKQHKGVLCRQRF